MSARKRAEVRAEDELLTPGETAELFRVDPRTVTRWAKAGWLSSIRTLGGHRRFRRVEVLALLAEGAFRPAAGPAAGEPGADG